MIKSVLTVFSGGFGAQLLALIGMGYFSRIATTSELGEYIEYIAILGILGNIACLRTEVLILREAKEYRAKVYFLTACCVSVISISFYVGISIFIRGVITYNLNLYLYAGISACFFGIFQSCIMIATRRGNLWDVSVFVFSRAAVVIFLQFLSLLTLPKSTNALILGQTLGYIVSAIFFLMFLKRKKIIADFNVRKAKLSVFHAISQFSYIKSATVQTLVNSVSQTIPVLITKSLFPNEQLLQLYFSQRLTTTPSQVIGSSIRQASFENINRRIREKKNIINDYLDGLKKIFILGGSITVGAMIFGVDTAVYLFGPKASGVKFVLYSMAPLIIFELSVPLLMTGLLMIRKEHAILKWEIHLFIFRAFGMALTADFYGFYASIISFSLISIIMNLYLYHITIKYIRTEWIKR